MKKEAAPGGEGVWNAGDPFRAHKFLPLACRSQAVVLLLLLLLLLLKGNYSTVVVAAAICQKWEPSR